MGSRLEQKSNLVRKRIEGHTFEDEGGDEYGASSFGGFSEYFRRKKIKLQNLDAQVRAESDQPQIFKGIVCHVNGYTQPSLNDLHVMIVQHGGGFVQYLDGKTMVTHIIASNLTPKKKEEFKRYRIVKPAWIVDSVKGGKLLPWDLYRVIEEGAGQKVLGFQNGQVVNRQATKSQGYREQTENSWYTTQLQAEHPEQISAAQDTFLTQTITPNEDIEDDEFPLPEITSSMEQALNEAGDVCEKHDVLTAIDGSVQAFLGTPPPTSPPLIAANDDEKAEASLSLDSAKSDPGDPQISALRPREGSQEPDYSMSVIRNSEVLRSVSPSRLAHMTAEEHNALLLSDPKIRKSTVVHPEFLEQYYRESRLHHLSTWKADLKAQLQALAAEKSSSQKAKQRRPPGQRRYIMHIDFDSFFAAVSLKKYPQYIDKPAVVAHGGGSGSEIASCNYPARAFGISNGMWMKRAQDLCPEVKILPYDFPAYEDASRRFYDAIMATGGMVQSVSIDEALVDVSAICIAASGQDGVKRNEGAVHREQTKADEIAQSLRDEVLHKTGCAVSVGIGGNILQAKIALRKAKPAGQYQLKSEDVLEFIGKLEVQKLPGVAWSIGGKLEEIGIKLVKDVREVTREKLVNTLGPKTGEKIWEYARGIDKAEVGDQVLRKSVSAEVNWGVRFENQEQVEEFMHGLCNELNKRLLKERVKGKQLTMKVMKRAVDAPRDPPKHLGHGKCDTYNKSLHLGVATNDAAVIAKEAISMMKSFNITPGELRGIGVQMQKLEPLKAGADGVDQGSQRRLQFMFNQPVKMSPEQSLGRISTETIQDDIRTPERQRVADANQPSTALRPVGTGTPSKKRLNVMGTQFILPTQVDPSVLAELPEDIRAKLSKHTSHSLSADQETTDGDRYGSGHASREESPALAIPPQSQIDPSILDALPPDVRKEIMGFYAAPRRHGEQAILPQSPRKNRTLPPSRQLIKRGRGRPRGASSLVTRLKAVAQGGENATLTQSNFVARTVSRPHTEDAVTTDMEAEIEEADPEFLAALPEDLRQEVLAQQRQTRLQRTGGIDLSMHQRAKAARKKKPPDDAGTPDRHFVLPPRAAKPAFTTRKLTELSDLRDAVSAWFNEFTDEGPYEEDVEALIRYLREVVLDEHDLSKAVAVVKWMTWIIDDGEDALAGSIHVWKEALGKTQQGVQDAAGQRGLDNVQF